MSKHKKHKNPNQNTNINEDPNAITTEEEFEEVDDEMEDEVTEEEVEVVEETLEETLSEVTEPIEEKHVEVIKPKEFVEVHESYYTVASGLKFGNFINRCGNFVTRDQAIKKANSATIETGIVHNVYDPTGKIIFTAKTKLTLFAKKKGRAQYVNRNLK